MTAIIEARQLQKHYGGPLAVRDVSFSVTEGEFLSLLGASGSGKTTTLRMIAGLETPTGGAVLFRGQDITHVPAAQRDMRMVFQDFALFPNLTVWDNVAFGLRLRINRGRVTQEEIKARVGRYLETVMLSSHARKMPHQLSGGQRQRVSLARALVTDPPVVLFDEPLGSLDASMRKSMQLELKRLHRELRKTFIYVTHDQEEAMGLSDRVAVLQDGRLLQIAPPDDIYFRPNSAEVARFVGAANVLEGVVESSGDGVAVVRLAGDARVEARDNAAGVAVGDPVTVMLRAEQLRMARAGTAAAGGIAARVTERLFLGDKVRYELRLPGSDTRLTALDTGDRRPAARPHHRPVTARRGPGMSAGTLAMGRDRRQLLLWLVPPLLWFAVFMVIPYCLLFYYSLGSTDYMTFKPGFSLANLARVFQTEPYLSVLLKSARIGAMTAIGATILAYPVAFCLAFHTRSARSKFIIYLLVIVPWWAAYLVKAYAWKTILGTSGILNALLLNLHLINEPLTLFLYNPFSVVLTLVYIFTPFSILSIYAQLERIPTSMLEASSNLGATTFETLTKLVIPLSLPGVVAGAIITFALATGDFIAPALVGGPDALMISNVVINLLGVAFDWPMAASIGIVVIGIGTALISVAQYLEHRAQVRY